MPVDSTVNALQAASECGHLEIFQRLLTREGSRAKMVILY